ncbi:SecDF P1 head subdomain-containing protein [Mycobacterium deserti]|uniref:SecDF P1 head subdomain domain-containing protein n=1 Tax=Mycobacterium deserti TaxID=2978347 RepID=A0ABT2MBK0_9MYCO|nr:hypothetical protein [Mycobacterium deserti]MCT7659637.1 hypothetical protein [Mycobacterium deserti]
MSEMPHPGYPGAPPGPARRSTFVPFLVLGVLVVLIAAYVLLAVATRTQWMGTAPQDGTEVTFTARAMDGSSPSPDALSRGREMVAARADELGLSGVQVVVDGDTLTVAAPGDGAAISQIGQVGQLYIRPVINAIPAESGSTSPSSPRPPAPDLVARIANERQLRQSTDQQIQLLALQFQASRCTDNDDLAGQDDPQLPLVTCSQDNTQVYLLDKAIMSGEHIENADWEDSEQRGEPVVDLEFTGEGTKTWGEFTAANVGDQTAFVVDTKVISAPVIMEAIPGGRLQITGRFEPADAKALASVLGHDPLPLLLTFEASTPKTVAGQPASTVVRIGLLAGGAVLVLGIVGSVVYLARGAGNRGAAPEAF